jgi:hypothetical protein
MAGVGFGAEGDIDLPIIVIPDLIRDPSNRGSHGSRIKSGMTKKWIARYWSLAAIPQQSSPQ